MCEQQYIPSFPKFQAREIPKVFGGIIEGGGGGDKDFGVLAKVTGERKRKRKGRKSQEVWYKSCFFFKTRKFKFESVRRGKENAHKNADCGEVVRLG